MEKDVGKEYIPTELSFCIPPLLVGKKCLESKLDVKKVSKYLPLFHFFFAVW